MPSSFLKCVLVAALCVFPAFTSPFCSRNCPKQMDGCSPKKGGLCGKERHLAFVVRTCVKSHTCRKSLELSRCLYGPCMSTECGFQGYIPITKATCFPGLDCLPSLPTWTPSCYDKAAHHRLNYSQVPCVKPICPVSCAAPIAKFQTG